MGTAGGAGRPQLDGGVLVDIIARHAEEAAMLWRLRDAAVRSPAYDLAALRKLDDRVEAHLDGLRIAGDVGWEAARAALVDPDAGEVFAATVLAVERASATALAEALAHGVRRPELARGVVSALGWVPLAQVKGYLEELLADDAPATLHLFGIAGAGVHRCDPGPRLQEAARESAPALKARALRTIGEIGRAGLLPELTLALDADDEACRFWAAWSAALLGAPAAGDALCQLARETARFAERALSMSVRVIEPPAARALVHELAGGAGKVRVALAGAAALGDPALLPWVSDCMAIPEHARFAGWTFSMITGVDLAAQKLSARPPPGFRSGPSDDPGDASVAPDPDEGLPWPDVAAVRASSDRWRVGLSPGVRHFLGKPMTTAWLTRVLRLGAQPARAAAAVELSLMAPGSPLLEVRAPGFRQARLLREATPGH